MNQNKETETFILKTISATGKKLSRSLNRNEVQGLIGYIKTVNLKSFKTHDLAVANISTQFANKLSNNVRHVPDVHEIMKRQLGGSSTSDIYRPVKCATDRLDTKDTSIYKQGDNSQNSSYLEYEGFADIYHSPSTKTGHINLLLDSYYKNLSFDNSTFKWSILQSTSVQQGVVNIMNVDVKNIKSMQFYNFNIPYTASAHNVYNKISLYIEEFSPSAILINPNRGYHMLFDSSTTGSGSIHLTPPYVNNGIFKFRTPINVLDTITIRFQSPFSPVTFLPDRYDITISSSGTDTVLTFSEEHKILDSELVHISKFNTSNANIDYAKIDEVNREIGHTVTYVDNVTLHILNLDISSVTFDPTNIAICFVASRRLIIPLTLEYMM